MATTEETDPDESLLQRQNRLLKFYCSRYEGNEIKGKGGPHHKKAQEKIARLLQKFYYRVETEKEAVVDMLGIDDKTDGNKDYSIDILAAYPRSKFTDDITNDDMSNWTVRFSTIAVEIDTSASKRVKGHGKTGHKSKRAHIKDLVRENEIIGTYGVDCFCRFEATDISLDKEYERIGEERFLAEMGLTRFPYDKYYNKDGSLKEQYKKH